MLTDDHRDADLKLSRVRPPHEEAVLLTFTALYDFCMNEAQPGGDQVIWWPRSEALFLQELYRLCHELFFTLLEVLLSCTSLAPAPPPNRCCDLCHQARRCEQTLDELLNEPDWLQRERNESP
jgi:hypothetical protein